MLVELDGCMFAVNAGQLEWMHLPQHQVPPAGQCNEACACWAQWWSFRLAACHRRSRIIWSVI